MLTREQFATVLAQGPVLLDGATGSNLQKAGMPRGCCSEEWILANPEKLITLQKQYVQAGSQILYAPTFQAQPVALAKVGLEKQTAAVNAHLVALSKSVSPDVLVAGNLTTLAAFAESWAAETFDLLVDNYRRQIAGLLEGGADLLAAETLLYPQEAEAIFTAAELEGADTVLYSFTMQADGALFSGRDAAPVLRELAEAGAAAVGFNCVSAGPMTPGLVSRLKRYVKGPLLCKPNAGDPVIGEDGLAQYPMGPEDFARTIGDCLEAGAAIIGGCCGTTPQHIAAVKAQL